MHVFQSSLPSPEAQTIAEDESRWLLSILGSKLPMVAEARLVEGLTIEPIAKKCEASPSTVAPMFQEVRAIWLEAVRKYRD